MVQILVLGQVGSLFTAPWLAAAGAAAVAIPVAVHLLSRLRRRQERWGAMRFLLLAYRRHKRRLQLEQWLLLATRCLLVLLLGLALAGPLMGGFVGQMLGGADQRGRVVHLVLSDALSTRTTTAGAQANDTTGDAAGNGEAAAPASRFDELREKALALIDGLKPGDRVALWRTGRPHAAVIENPTRDHARVRSKLKAMRPRYSRPDTGETLTAVADQLHKQQVRPDRGLVIVLSDFPQSADYLTKPPKQTQQRLADHARLRITRPAAGTSNAQIAALGLRQGLLLAQPGEPATAGVTATVKRFTASPAPDRRQMTVTLQTLDGRVLAETTRPVTWRRGQASTSMNLTLTTDQGQPMTGEGGQSWVVRGRLSETGAADRLRADDTVWAVAEVRPHLEVGLIGGDALPGNGNGAAPAGGVGNGEADQLPPAQWLRLALSPGGVGDAGPLRPRAIEPGALGGGDEPLSTVDAAFVLSPGRVDESGWATLAEFARTGGLVWVVAPPRRGAGAWIEPMRSAFELDWRIDLEPAGPGEAENEQEDTTRPLETDIAAPEPLARLAADWPALLRPVRVTRWLSMDVPTAQRWLALEPTGDRSGPTVLASRQLGAGRIVMQSLPLHTGWSNLPTKPVMVPLVHETIRATLGRGSDPIVTGDQPTLGPRWAGVDRLVAASKTAGQAGESESAANGEPAGDDERAIVLESEAGSTSPARAFREPGPYQAAGSGQALAVNVDPAGGDVRGTTNERLAEWFDRLAGDRWQYLPRQDPASVLATTTERASLGWPLLWAVLGLALLELALARYFSHAQRADRPGIHHRLAEFWRHLRHAR